MRTRGATRRRLCVAAVVLVPAILASCSHTSGSKSSTSGRPEACKYVTKLDTIAAAVAAANVNDPDTFKKTLDSAVAQYAENVRSLRAVAPSDLQAGLDQVEADVQQHRFDAALTDRAQLDAYAQRECGRLVTTETTAATATTATTASSASSAPVLGSSTSVAVAAFPTTTPTTASGTSTPDSGN